MTVLDQLNRRYATKKFNSNKKVSESDLEVLLESLRLSPSSFGLQPRKFLVIEDLELRKSLKQYSRNQAQITDCSHLIVLCGIKNYSRENIAKAVELGQENGKNIEEMQKRVEDISNILFQKNYGKSIENRVDKEVFLALGFLLSACSQLQIDSCPIGGFENEKYDEILGLEQENLRSVVCCAVGYRSEDDPNAKKVKTRFPAEEIFIRK